MTNREYNLKSLRMSRRGMGGKRLCTARASRGGAHGRAWVRVRANSRAVQGSWCAHAAVDHRELLEIDGDGRRTEREFRPRGRGKKILLWENRCLGSSSGTSKSQCTVPESKKTFILNEKVLPVQAIAFLPNFTRKRPNIRMSSGKSVVKARRQVRQLHALAMPAAHTRTSGTALEPTRHEHPGRQRHEWFHAHEASRRASRPFWPMAAPSGQTA